ncbi:hypothetical protein Tco_0105849 [Tanacetum coccineum]
MDIVPRLESRVESLEKELSETKQTLGTAILQLMEKVKKLENKLRKKRKSKETKGCTRLQKDFKGSQAPLGSKEILPERKPKSNQLLPKFLHFEEPDESQVNNVSTPFSLKFNTAEFKHQGGEEIKELQELADLEEAQRLQAKMDAETQRQIDLDALLARRLILAEKIQQEEREQYSIEDRAKFLHDYNGCPIGSFLLNQRSAAIRRKKATNQYLRFRNQDDHLSENISDEDRVMMLEILNHQYPSIEWASHFSSRLNLNSFKPKTTDEDIYLNKKEDLKVIYELVMEEYKDKLPEGFDKMLWGDLMIMFNQGDTADFWDTQQTIGKLYQLEFTRVPLGYPLAKEVLSQMLELKLETEEESSMALELIKFVKQQLEELQILMMDDF